MTGGGKVPWASLEGAAKEILASIKCHDLWIKYLLNRNLIFWPAPIAMGAKNPSLGAPLKKIYWPWYNRIWFSLDANALTAASPWQPRHRCCHGDDCLLCFEQTRLEANRLEVIWLGQAERAKVKDRQSDEGKTRTGNKNAMHSDSHTPLHPTPQCQSTHRFGTCCAIINQLDIQCT